jgi:hypothetical protein
MKKDLLMGGLLGIIFLGVGYFLLWIRGDNTGWIFLGLAVINYLRMQQKIRKA